MVNHTDTYSQQDDFEGQSTGAKRIILTPLKTLITEAEPTVQWLVKDMLITGGSSIIIAKPKVGKSTLARNLSLCVARGEPFLGQETMQGLVIYLALEEKRDEIRRHFIDMGADGTEDILIHSSSAPSNALIQIREIVIAQTPALLVVDPVFKGIRVKDTNDYTSVTNALEPLTDLARETGTHILNVHHEGKGQRAGGDEVLGSTAILGAVDCALFLKKRVSFR